MMAADSRQNRAASGRYTFDGNFERLCRCGHKFGIHAAAEPFPCFNEDRHIDGATGAPCACERFAPKVRR